MSREDRGSFIAVLLGEEEELEGTAARDSTHRLSLSFLICELRLTIREFIREDLYIYSKSIYTIYSIFIIPNYKS